MTHIYRIHGPHDMLIYRHTDEHGKHTYTSHPKGRVTEAKEVANPEALVGYGLGHNMLEHGEGQPYGSPT